MALTNKLSAIGDAIREKTGKTDLMTLDQMPVEISSITTGGGGGYVPTDDELRLIGDCANLFSNNKFKWMIDNYGNRITTDGIISAEMMFHEYHGDNIPFVINSAYELNCRSMFQGAYIRGTFPKIVMTKTTDYVKSIEYMFSEYKYDNIPDDYFNSMASSKIYQYVVMQGVFKNARYITKIPSSWLTFTSKFPRDYDYYNPYKEAFNSCYSLKKLNNLHTFGSFAIDSNCFIDTFTNTSTLNSITFAPLPEGTEYKQWKNQVISLNGNVGYGVAYIIGDVLGNSKQVIDDATYQTLKNTDDWWTADINYSRYNHDSAVETINSLPNTKPYLDANGGTNTIKFKGASGALTDGGAINTMTEEEIAVATAKGWSVALV